MSFLNADDKDDNLPTRLVEIEVQLLALMTAGLKNSQRERLYGNSLKHLHHELQYALDVLKVEYSGAEQNLKTSFYPLFAEFQVTIANCEALIERLNNRNAVMAFACFSYDCRQIKKMKKDVAQNRSDLRRRITQLKHQPLPPTNDHFPRSAGQRPQASVPLSPSIPTSTVTSLHSVSDATIQNSQFSSAANDIINTTFRYPPIVNNQGIIILLNIHGSGRATEV